RRLRAWERAAPGLRSFSGRAADRFQPGAAGVLPDAGDVPAAGVGTPGVDRAGQPMLPLPADRACSAAGPASPARLLGLRVGRLARVPARHLGDVFTVPGPHRLLGLISCPTFRPKESVSNSRSGTRRTAR